MVIINTPVKANVTTRVMKLSGSKVKFNHPTARAMSNTMLDQKMSLSKFKDVDKTHRPNN